jgi:hypothetical protein
MTYWWVNQNQTWQYEIDGGFLWSPKQKRNGSHNQFYENMRLVRQGDTIFSYLSLPCAARWKGHRTSNYRSKAGESL